MYTYKNAPLYFRSVVERERVGTPFPYYRHFCTIGNTCIRAFREFVFYTNRRDWTPYRRWLRG